MAISWITCREEKIEKNVVSQEVSTVKNLSNVKSVNEETLRLEEIPHVVLLNLSSVKNLSTKRPFIFEKGQTHFPKNKLHRFVTRKAPWENHNSRAVTFVISQPAWAALEKGRRVLISGRRPNICLPLWSWENNRKHTCGRFLIAHFGWAKFCPGTRNGKLMFTFATFVNECE